MEVLRISGFVTFSTTGVPSNERVCTLVQSNGNPEVELRRCCCISKSQKLAISSLRSSVPEWPMNRSMTPKECMNIQGEKVGRNPILKSRLSSSRQCQMSLANSLIFWIDFARGQEGPSCHLLLLPWFLKGALIILDSSVSWPLSLILIGVLLPS